MMSFRLMWDSLGGLAGQGGDPVGRGDAGLRVDVEADLGDVLLDVGHEIEDEGNHAPGVEGLEVLSRDQKSDIVPLEGPAPDNLEGVSPSRHELCHLARNMLVALIVLLDHEAGPHRVDAGLDQAVLLSRAG